MRTVLEKYLGEVKIGRRQTHKNLTLVPLLSAYTLELEYLLLDEALSEGVIEIVEVSKEGAVPDLKVVNKSPRMVLILDGEELVGAKQNRIVNTTILIPGETVVIIPVSCVEAGRWNYESAQFYSEKRIMSAELRAKKADQVNFSLRTSGRHRSDQGAIWNEISEKAARRGARSPSMAMAEIYKKDRPSLDEYLKHFHLIGSQVGAVFMIGGKVAGMDGFGKPETFASVFKKLVESYALDAIDWYVPQKEGKSHKSDVMAFLKAASRRHLRLGPQSAPAPTFVYPLKRSLDLPYCSMVIFCISPSFPGQMEPMIPRVQGSPGSPGEADTDSNQVSSSGFRVQSYSIGNLETRCGTWDCSLALNLEPKLGTSNPELEHKEDYMARIEKFEDIEAWQKARELTRLVYAETVGALFSKDYGLRDQIRRAAVSVMSNIAEGFERDGNKEFRQFLSMAKGSAGEVKSHLYVALDAGYLKQRDFDSLYACADEAGRLIGGFMRYIEKSSHKGAKFKDEKVLSSKLGVKPTGPFVPER